MVHLTLAISDFMVMLISAAFWTGAGLLGWALLAAGLSVGVWLAISYVCQRR